MKPSICPHWWASLALLSACTGALAQPSEPKSGPADPLEARAAVPPLAYSSPFARYRPAGTVEVGSWQAANETVTRIGGWRTYLREANQPETPAAAPAAPGAAAGRVPDAPTGAATPAAPATRPPHGGHSGH